LNRRKYKPSSKPLVIIVIDLIFILFIFYFLKIYYKQNPFIAKSSPPLKYILVEKKENNRISVIMQIKNTSRKATDIEKKVNSVRFYVVDADNHIMIQGKYKPYKYVLRRNESVKLMSKPFSREYRGARAIAVFVGDTEVSLELKLK